MTLVRDIPYESDGRTMVGRLAVPDGVAERSTPAVLIAHEGNGLDELQRDRAELLAELGYVGFALDYHGGGTPPEFAEAQHRIGALWDDRDRMRSVARAGLEVLLGEPAVDPARVVAIGYCFGATLMLELGRAGADLKAIVGFHPGLRPTASPDNAAFAGVVLLSIGSEDPYATLDDRVAFEREMQGTGVDWRMHVYGGIEHSFTNPTVASSGLPGLRYDEPTARRAWQSMLDLFDEVL